MPDIWQYSFHLFVSVAIVFITIGDEDIKSQETYVGTSGTICDAKERGITLRDTETWQVSSKRDKI